MYMFLKFFDKIEEVKIKLFFIILDYYVIFVLGCICVDVMIKCCFEYNIWLFGISFFL